MPVRKIPPGRNSITGRFTRGPGGGSIGFESTLERDFVTLMSFEPDVLNIEDQPVRIDYMDAEKRHRHYTPDYLVHRNHAVPLLAEIKPSKFVTQDLEPKFDAARNYAAIRGWVFEVWTEKDIRTQRLNSIRFLERYRRLHADPGRVDRILNSLEADGPQPIETLLQACWNEETERNLGEDVLWHLLATGILQTRMDIELSEHSVISKNGRMP